MDEQTKLTSIDNNVEEQSNLTQETDVFETPELETEPTLEDNTISSEGGEPIETVTSQEESTETITFREEFTETDTFQEESTETKEENPTKPQTITEMLQDEDMEYSKDEFEQMAEMYNKTMTDFVAGEVVIGKVLSISDKEVSVDIGFKSEGTILLEEFPDPTDIIVGDTLEVFLDEIEDNEGQLVLSKKKADFMRVWSNINASYDKGEIIKGKCVRRIKGGIVVDLSGVDAFLPGSQIDVKPIRDFDALIGRELEFKVVKINNLRKNIVVSHRVLVEEEVAEVRRQILDELERGQVLEGSVKNITDFGVFIDLGGVDGLLHINDLSWGRVSHPSEVVALDEKIKVVVLDFNDEKNRISLGLKQLQPHPWEDVDKKFPVDSVVRGKVVSISDYGAFVELEKGVEGLIHISEMSWTQHIKHPSKVLSVGEMVEAKVLNIEKEERKISLGLKQLDPDPWESLAERYPVGTHHKGKVRNLTNFGAFVELEEGIDGLVHISDLSWTKKVRHPGEVIKKGEDLEVVVLSIDRDNRRISLGYKQTIENPWETFEENYKPGTLTTGKIVRLIEKGVVVELPLQVEGFVPMSHLDKRGLTKPADQYKLDDEIELCVIEFSKDNKKIVLSEKRAHEKMAVTGMETTPVTEREGAAKTEASEDEAKEVTEPTQAVEETEAVPETETESEQQAETQKDEAEGVESIEQPQTEESEAEASEEPDQPEDASKAGEGAGIESEPTKEAPVEDVKADESEEQPQDKESTPEKADSETQVEDDAEPLDKDEKESSESTIETTKEQDAEAESKSDEKLKETDQEDESVTESNEQPEEADTDSEGSEDESSPTSDAVEEKDEEKSESKKD